MSNIPYAVTSTDLQTLFSDIAPVRYAFVVLEHSTGVSKGIGYVSFAIKEDACAAYDKISEEGLSILGRALRVEWAHNKVVHSPSLETMCFDHHCKSTSKEDGKASNQPKPRPSVRASQPRKPHDPLAIRTITVTGLPKSINSKSLWKKSRKYDGAEKVEWPVIVDGSEDLESGGYRCWILAVHRL